MLLVSAWKKEGNPADAAHACTSFNRSFVLPHDVDESRIKTRCRDGVLKVSLGKRLSSGAGELLFRGEKNWRVPWHGKVETLDWEVLLNRAR